MKIFFAKIREAKKLCTDQNHSLLLEWWRQKMSIQNKHKKDHKGDVVFVQVLC